MKLMRFSAVLITFSFLSACQNPEKAADELAGASVQAEAAVFEAIKANDLIAANKIVSAFSTKIRETVTNDLDGDFCSVPFAGFTCEPSKSYPEMSQKTRGHLERTAARYVRMIATIKDNTPVSDPLLAEFRAPNSVTARQDLVSALAPQTDLRSRIVFNMLKRGTVATCRDMRALGNEFERDEAYKNLTQTGPAEKPNPSLPLKAMVAIKGGSYDLDSQSFRPSGEIAIAGRNQTYKISSRINMRGGRSDLMFKISLHACKGDEIRNFSDELHRRGETSNLNAILGSELKVVYRSAALKTHLREAIPVPKDQAKSIVDAFSKSRVQAVREERPFFVAVNLRMSNSKPVSFEKGTVILPVEVTHMAYYPLRRPVVSDSSIRKDFYVGMAPNKTFERGNYPSVQPVFQKVVE